MRASKTSPLIGITTYGRESDGHPVFARDIFRVPSNYVDAIQRAGGSVLLLPPARRQTRRLLDLLDGVLLIGGGDVNPARYGAKTHPSVYHVDDDRDTFEIEIVKTMIAESKPFLGVCRGIQVVNVALGGDLLQHLPDEGSDTVDHAGYPSAPRTHRVTLEPSSKLAAELQMTTFEVTSWHHQALKRVADALTVVGRADDGVVEAVEIASHPWGIAVQWHPEIDAETNPTQQRLFNRFVEAARHRV